MTATIIDGKKVSEEILADVKKEVSKLNIPLRLGIVVVGNDPASSTYIEQKKKKGEIVGIKVDVFKYNESETSTHKLRQEINRISRLSGMQGVIVQLPLPDSINTERVVNAIPQDKDVDVLSKTSFGAFTLGASSVRPPTVGAILKLMEAYNLTLTQKKVAIVGTGRLIGLPMAIEAIRHQATTCVINEYTKDPTAILQESDIIITGTPIPEHIRGDAIKKGAVVIDGGYVRTEKNKVTGNVVFEEAQKKASFITPVPGGVGAVTVAMLFSNLLTLVKAK